MVDVNCRRVNSPREYIRLRKLEHAYYLITRSSQLNITELALKLGFSSPSQFSKFFRKQYGVLPSELNKK
ncbi:helix-turn-helix domain-containing protein [Nitrincola alkalisediminis]|uniref:helix-turn-helix domain-containing protein n=1 Tax=Nitrincola alkalisediminis TaxID=1366656 RepID=UPI001875F9EF